ncbi:MAG: hypothetical protein M1820_003723 [Bogoriella megaspora]|nr:MAG: hypothetical protein M1820_003723 [Bogoriella megaspora]
MPTAPADRLAEEVGRIVSADYAVSLKKLRDLLREFGTDAVERWSEERPCQLPQLATAVLEALPTWPYTLTILEYLCRAPRFGNALLHQDPNLLDSFLDEAIKSSHGYDQYARTCSSLLSHQLLPEVPLPASAQTFLSRLIERTTSSPDEPSLEYIYGMLSGACGGLLDAIPFNLSSRLEHVLLNGLRHERSATNPRLRTLCLAVMVICVKKSPQDVELSFAPTQSDDTGIDVPLSPAHGFANLATYFEGSQAPQTIKALLAHYVQLSNDRSTSKPICKKYKELEIITTVAEAVSQDERQYYEKYKPDLGRKLCHQALECKADPLMQVWMIVFLGGLCGVDRLPKRVLARFQDLVLDDQVLSMPEPDHTALLERSSSMLGIAVTESFGSTFLMKAFAAVSDESASLTSLRNLKSMCCTLEDAAQDFQELRKGLLHAVCTNEMQKHLRAFLGFRTEPLLDQGTCSPEIRCPQAIHRQRNLLGSAVCDMLVKLALGVQGDVVGLDSTTASILVDKHAAFNHAVGQQSLWHDARPKAKVATPILQQASTPQDPATTDSWRSRLAGDIQRRAKDQEHAIIQSMAQVCREFEERCDDIEEPLRIEQDRSKSLRSQCDEANDRIQQLEFHLSDSVKEVGKLKDEQQDNTAVILEKDAAVRDAERRLKGSEEMIVALKEEHEREVQKLKEQHDSRVLAVEASMAVKNNEADESRQESHEWAGKHQELENNLAQHVRAMDHLRHELKESEEYVATLNHDLEAEQAAAREQHDLCMDSRMKLDDMDHEVKLVRETLFTCQQELSSAQRSYKQLERSSMAEIEDLRSSHQIQVNELLLRSSEEKTELKSKLDKAVENHLGAIQANEAAQVQNDKIIKDLRQKNDRLESAYVEKEAQAAEANSRLQNIKASLGVLPSPHKAKRTKASLLGNKPIAQPSTRRRRHHQETLPPDTPIAQTQGLSTANESFNSYSSSTKSGPTPKRLRPRKGFKIPTMKPLIGDTAKKAHGTRSNSKREPLKNLPVNESPSRRRLPSTEDPGDAINRSCKSKTPIVSAPSAAAIHPKPNFVALPQYSFDEDEIFTSTPAFGSAKVVPQDMDFDDETTVDLE